MSKKPFVSDIRGGLARPGTLKKASIAAVALAVVVAGLTGCSSGTSSTTSSDKTLTLYDGSAPPSLNPMLQSSKQVTNNLAYDSLLIQTGATKFTPELAKSFAYVGTGNTKIEITLRKNVKFADGTAMTAQGIEAYMKAAIAASKITTDTFPVSSYSTPDSSTLDISFSKPFPYAQLQFDQAGIFGTPVSPKALTSTQLGAATFGAGPYKLDASQTTTGTTYTFVKNTNYYAPSKQHWQKVVLKIIGNNASRLQSVEAGSYSLEQGAPSDDSTAKKAGLNLVTNPATSNYGIMILDRDGKIVPALANLKVRQALNYAVNRTADAKAIGGTAHEQIAANGYVGYYSSNVYSHNVAKAKKLLTEAGYANGFTLPILYEQTDPLSSTVVQILVPELKAIGVTVKLTAAVGIQTYGTDQASGKYPAAVQQMQGQVFTLTTSRIFAPGGLFNPLGTTWPTSSFESQYLKASAESGSAATADWSKLGQYITNNAWLVDVAGLSSTYYTSKDLKVPPAWGVYPDPVLMAPTK
jgi:peptide/nickel transport system substrate-binding protein